jgi:hypothetical protein
LEGEDEDDPKEATSGGEDNPKEATRCEARGKDKP